MKVLLDNFHLNGRTLEFYPDLKFRTTLLSIVNIISSSVLIALHVPNMLKGCTVFSFNDYRGISDIHKLYLF